MLIQNSPVWCCLHKCLVVSVAAEMTQHVAIPAASDAFFATVKNSSHFAIYSIRSSLAKSDGEPTSPFFKFVKDVLTKTQDILDQQDLLPAIHLTLEAATGILQLVDDFQTNKADIECTTQLVAQITESITDCLSTRVWNENDVSFLALTLRELKSYLDGLHEESSTWMAKGIDPIVNASRIADDLKKWDDRMEKAALALNLKHQGRQDSLLNETNVAVMTSINILKEFEENLTRFDENMGNNVSKIDAFLEYFIQFQRTSELYHYEVTIHNRTANEEVFRSLEDIQRKLDQEANNQSPNQTFDLVKRLQRWMISTKNVHYDTEDLISMNQMANVYRGTYFGKPVAIKCFLGILNTDSFDLEKYVSREIRCWERASKLPYVSRLHGVCTKVSKILIVSEWCPHTVLTYLELHPSQLLTVIYELICGLSIIHECGMHHGDLKTSNVLVTMENHVAISDFGLTKSVLTSLSRANRINHSLDQRINWSSPEMVFQARRAGLPSDMWSFAMIVYQIISKQTPYQDSSSAEIMQAIKTDHDRPMRPVDLNPQLYPLWKQLKRCWLKDPQDRLTAREFKNFMEATYSVHCKDSAPGGLMIQVHSAKGLAKTSLFVELTFRGQTYMTPMTLRENKVPHWDTCFKIEANSDVDVNEKIRIRVISSGENQVLAFTTVTFEQLFEARRQNQDVSNLYYKVGFPLHPKGRAVVEAFIADENAYRRSRVIMKNICAIEVNEDFTLKSTVCILGPHASGKCTLINSLFGRYMCKTELWGGCTKTVQWIGDTLDLALQVTRVMTTYQVSSEHYGIAAWLLFVKFLKQDSEDIMQSFSITNVSNFYIDARAILEARRPGGKPINKELCRSWIDMLHAIREANGNPIHPSELEDIEITIHTDSDNSVLSDISTLGIYKSALPAGFYSIRSAIKIIQQSLEGIEVASSKLVTTSTSLLKLCLDIPIHREKVLTTGLLVECILVHAIHLGHLDDDSNLLSALEKIVSFWQSALTTVQTLKLHLEDTQTFEIERIGVGTDQLHQDLENVAIMRTSSAILKI
ncbi:hypothetical protein Ae201684P_001096 [Aphanomyces euteiches]|nr:hypothetical protein Ae201684P_001096 [Aphanomyces euteiches]